MSDSIIALRRKIASAGDLKSVVGTMKALAASSIGQYEQAVVALADYHRTIQLGLGACLRQSETAAPVPEQKRKNYETSPINAIVFGSDQGLVGQFNEIVADHAIKTLAAIPGKPAIWAVGERVSERLSDAGLQPIGLFPVPNSVRAITPLVGQIQLASEAHRANNPHARVYVFHNRPKPGALYDPTSQRLLPLDKQWQSAAAKIPWPTHIFPEVLHPSTTTLAALIREYLFISLFQACAESLASENASRLAATQRADKNIGDLLDHLNGVFHRQRQTSIDEELFDVVSGFEALHSNV